MIMKSFWTKIAMTHLIIDAFQVLGFGFPELQLNKWAWELSVEHKLSRVFLEDISDLMCPLNDHRLYGMDESPIICLWPAIV